MIKPELARGDLQCIGATTLDEYRAYIEADPALERRFQPVLIREPSIEETVAILRGLRAKYAAHHVSTSATTLWKRQQLFPRAISPIAVCPIKQSISWTKRPQPSRCARERSLLPPTFARSLRNGPASRSQVRTQERTRYDVIRTTTLTASHNGEMC